MASITSSICMVIYMVHLVVYLYPNNDTETVTFDRAVVMAIYMYNRLRVIPYTI